MVSLRSVLLSGALAILSVAQLSAQASSSPTCAISAVPPVVRAEGLAERVGDIILNCTGRAGAVITGNLTVSLNANITNRLVNNRLDAALSVDTGSGRSLLAVPELLGPNQAVFAGITFPIGPNGSTELRITNLRADATQGTSGLATLQANLAFNPPSLLTVSGARFTVAVPQQGLRSTIQPGSVASQIGSPVPEDLTFSGLIAAGTRFATTRITEGFASAFEPRGSGADAGTRVMLRFTGYPEGSRLFVPNVIIGSNGRTPTTAGGFGGVVSGGEYSANALALVRVLSASADGAGGSYAPVTGYSVFNEVSEVSVIDGRGYAVYEVVDANPASIETAQIPVFLGLPRTIEGRTLTTGGDVFFAPVSSVAVASANQPVPRYKTAAPLTDCSALGDCSDYVPKLEAYPQPTSFVAFHGGQFQMRWIPFENIGGGVMVWSARVEYKNGSNWLRVSPTSGMQGNILRLDVIPMGLPVGMYEATVIIDAGPAGVARYPVTLDVKAPLVPAPAITSIGSAATFSGPLTRGGLATIKGANLAGANVTVAFDGKPATLLFTSAGQINLRVPTDLTGTSTRVVVTANGVASPAQTIELAAVAPGIFANGVLNQDNRPNSPEAPAMLPSIVQIFATGLLPPDGSARIEVKLNDRFFSDSQLLYANEAPGLPGVQQVNFLLPAELATGSADLQVCATPANGTRVCSPTTRLSVRTQ